MASKKINGITIAINADTSGVTAGLKDLTSQSVSLSKQLKTVDSLLKLDPKNTELLATKQKLLSDSVETTKKKLQALKGAQEDVKKAVASGSIGTEEYVAFQKELVQTERRLKELEAQENGTADSVQNLGDDTAKAGAQMQEAGEKSGRLSAALKTGVEAAAKAAAAALAAVSAAAFKLTKDIISSTGELEQNLGGSESVFGDYAESIRKSGEEAYKNMGVSQSEYLATANKMGALFQGSGMTIEESAEATQKAMQRAADMASVMGIDMSSALESVAGAAKGNFTMMDNLGVAINDTTLKAYAASHGLGELKTTQDKVSAAMQMFLDTTEQYDGNFAKEATETISGSFGLLSASWQSMIAGLGNSESDIDKITGNVLSALESVVDNIEPVLKNIVKSLPKVVDSLLKSVDKLLPKILPMAVQIIKQLGDALIKSAPRLLKAASGIVQSLVGGITKKLPTLIPAAIKMLLGLVDGLLDHMGIIVDGALALVTGLADGIINSLPVMIEKAPEIVGKLVDGIVDALPKLLDAGAAIIGKLFDYFSDGENLKNMLAAGLKIVVKIAAGIKNAFVKIVEKGKEIIEKVWEGISQKISDAYEWGKQLMWNFLEGVEAVWKDTRWWQFWSGFGEFLFDAFHPGEVQGQNLQDWENKMRDMPALYDDTPESYRRMTGAKGIPVFGSGGVVTVPTKAIIGENGAEAVVPLENNTAWIDKLAARLNRAGGGGYSAQINVTVYGNNMNDIGNQIAAKIDTALRRYQVQQVRGQGGATWPT